jgi:Sulfotransferase domain
MLFRRTKKLCFFHLPRTGGTALREDILFRNFRGWQICSVNYDPQLRAFEGAHDALRWSRLRRAGIRILAGHMPYGFTDRFPGRFDYITLLRNPIARAASDYHFSRKTHTNSASSAARQLSLAEYVDRNYGQSNNCYARWLSNAVFGAAYSSETEMLNAALRNLSQFSFIGITEEFETSVQQLCLKYGLTQYGTTAQNRNDATPLDLKLSSEEVRAIERGNELDLAIYQHACREQQFRAA